jgi:hypothetical protein
MNLPLPAAQVPSETLSLETRSAGYSMVNFMNFIMTFVVGQSFLSMLCAFRVSNQRQTSPGHMKRQQYTFACSTLYSTPSAQDG